MSINYVMAEGGQKVWYMLEWGVTRGKMGGGLE